MARSQESFSKKEKEKKREKKRKEKEAKKLKRKENSSGGSLDDMIAYVDEFGNITDTPPDPDVEIEEVELESIDVSIPKKEDVVESPIRKGVVEFFNHSKGFGFIKDKANREKYFVHVNGLIDDIDEGDKVEFELEQGMKGLNAVRVKRI